jgi:3D (Asp-Asp-Asp) domain-containing protein
MLLKNPKARHMMAEISAYLPMDPEQSSMTGLARDGNPAIPFQTIAVDPRVIPFYSWVYVPNVGWFIAHDTGSAIKGNKMDICVDNYTWAMKWGRRTLEVVVIEPEE